MEVVAEHSTDDQLSADREGGELRPKGPTEGKVKPGRTSAEWKAGRDFELTTQLNVNLAECISG